MNEILEKIRNVYPELSSAKKSVASYFLNNYASLHYSTLMELADQIGVSDTTIINFCTDIGFSGFAGFKRALREELLKSKNVLSEEQQPKEHEAAAVDQLVMPIVKGIEATFSDSGNLFALTQGAALMAKAKRIYAVGFWAQSAIAQEFCLRLRRSGWDAEAIFPSMGDYIDKVFHITAEDVVIAYDFSLYISGMLEICQVLKKQNVPIILITDMGPCPCLPYAAVTVHCRGKTKLPNPAYANVTGAVFPTGTVVGYVLRALACSMKPHPQNEYAELREGIFSRFNPYGVLEPDGSYLDRI